MAKKTNLPNHSPPTLERPVPHLSDDDVYLLELWHTLTRRKGVISVVLLVSLIAAGLSIFLVSPVYESRAVLQIGQIGQIGQVESPTVLTKRILVQDDADQGKAATAKTRAFIHSAFLEKETNLVSIIARGSTPEAAREHIAQVVAKVIHEHQELFDLARKKQQQSLDLLQMRSQSLNQMIAANEKEMAALGTYILASERLELLEQRMLIEEKQMELRATMSALQSKPTTMIKAPTLSTDPVRPRPLLYFALAIGIGLMLGIFGAFAVEFISKARMSTSS